MKTAQPRVYISGNTEIEIKTFLMESAAKTLRRHERVKLIQRVATTHGASSIASALHKVKAPTLSKQPVAERARSTIAL
jgi:hypothetical protein